MTSTSPKHFRRHQSQQHNRNFTSLLIRAIAGMLLASLTVNMFYYSRLPDDHTQNAFAMSQQASPMLWKSSGGQVIKKDKKGNVLHRNIRRIDEKVLQGVGNNENLLRVSGESVNLQVAKASRQRLVALLTDAGVDDIDAESLLKLPTDEQVRTLYGDKPVVYGLDRCETFRNEFPKDDASIGVAGLFNTGTNPLAMYLAANCILPDNKSDRAGHGMRWQVPWGKHVVAKLRMSNTAGHDKRVNKTNVMPIVVVRDPYSWMQSMCKHKYASEWQHFERCPNLVPSAMDRFNFTELSEADTVPVSIHYPDVKEEWDSLADLWSDWYNQYLDAPYPRLIVRFEDLIFHPKELINEICTCAGAKAKQDTFEYVVDAGKWGASHRDSSNLISAMAKYGTDTNRFKGLNRADMIYASTHLDDQLMELFRYQIPQGKEEM